MRHWSPSLRGALAGAVVGGVGRAALVAIHLETIGAASVAVLLWAAAVGAAVGGLAGLAGAPWPGATLGVVLSALAYVVMIPVALFVTVLGVAQAPSLLEMMAVGALAGFAGGAADRGRGTPAISMKGQGRQI